MDFTETTVQNWDKLVELYNAFEPKTQWVFRGLSNADYSLETTLERAAKRFDLHLNRLSEIEPVMIRHFKRQAHRYLENLPKDDDTIEWLALMQHFGSPTRLLDWTYSFFVALFFAVEGAQPSCVVWAIDMDWIIEKAERLFPRADFRLLLEEDPHLKSGKFFKLVFDRRPPIALVYSLNPERLNERLIIQQGLFLAPGDISRPFEENLNTLSKADPNAKNHIWKIIIDAPVSSKRDILRHLHRMNINRASLFPGLDGFAQSLTTYLANPLLMGKSRY
jgi:hypothetical protein